MGGLLRATRRGAARGPGGTGWTATSTPTASGSTWSGCTGSACAACRCSTAAWAPRWSCPERVRHGSAGVAGRRPAGCTTRPSSSAWSSPWRPRAGWSAAGGPWVEPADAMKKVVWSETVVDGGRPVEQPLAPLPDVAGPVPGLPALGRRPGAHPVRPGLGRRWPCRPTTCRLRLAPVIGDGVGRGRRTGRRCSTAASPSSVSLPRDPDGRVHRVDRAGLRRSRSRSRRSPSACPDRAASEPRPPPARRAARPATTASPTASSPSSPLPDAPAARRCRCAPWRSRR